MRVSPEMSSPVVEADIPRRIPGRSLSLVPKASHPLPTDAAPMLTHPQNDNRVIINVGGVRYETFRSTLKNIPDTRLSWITETTSQNADYDPVSGEYFFDRHPGVFNMVLNYYRTGRLHAPTHVCGPLFEDELAFWGIDEKQIEPCCWMAYRTHRDAQETLAELEGGDSESEADHMADDVARRFGIEEAAGPEPSKWLVIRHKLWTLLEEPYSSKAAQVIAIISLMFVLLSITTFVLETNLTFRVARNESEPINPDWSNYDKNVKSRPHLSLVILEIICIAFFTLEFILRLVICPAKNQFFKSILNWVDIFSMIPFYVEKLTVLFNPEAEYSVFLQVMKAVRLIRIFRIFKLTRHFAGLKILGHTIKASARELLLLIMFLCISVLIFSCLIYYVESVDEHKDNDFKDIPIGFWWSVVTMTTLGYGDKVPRTALGYMVGAFCALSGVLVLALPVPVIVNNFALYYSHAQAKAKLPKKRKVALVGAPDLLKTQQSLPGTSLSEFVSSPSPSHSCPPSPGDKHSEASTDSGCCRMPHSYSADSTRTGISVVYTDDGESDTLSLHSLDKGSNPQQHLSKCVSEPCSINLVAETSQKHTVEPPPHSRRRNSFGLGHLNPAPTRQSARAYSLPDVVE